MTKFLFFLIILSIGFTFVPFNIKGDGGVFPPPHYWIKESDQKAVIFYEKGKETLILSITFRGDAKDFGWVIPVPQKPKITKGSDEIFTSLQEITQKYKKYRDIGIRKMGIGAPLMTEESVTIIETKKIDYYDITILSATDAQALAKWLLDNGYQYPEESAYILNDYINNQWYFVAVKISPEAMGAEEVIRELKEGHTTPLKLEFDSGTIIYPLRISSIQVGLGLIKLSENLILNRERINHLKDIGYEELADKEKGQEILKQIIKDLLEKRHYSESVANKYPLIISERDYATIVCSNFKHCENIVESWFNNYFSSQGLYYSPENYIPIHLYVIADHKKEIPKFSVNYANWIKAEEIRKLAYDINGRPLIEPQGRKYYLTYLYRNMDISEMTNDLVIRNAEDNKRVNAPNPWLNLFWGSLIALGCIFVWIFSPLGLIFIIATLVRNLSKIDIFRIFGRVFQILSFVITFGLFLFFLVLALKFSSVFPELFWAIGGLTVGLGLVLIGQILLMIKRFNF